MYILDIFIIFKILARDYISFLFFGGVRDDHFLWFAVLCVLFVFVLYLVPNVVCVS